MPVHILVDRKRKLVVTTYSGEVADSDVVRQISEIARHAPYDPDYRAITDFSDVTQFNISTEQIKAVADTKSPLESAKRVMVAPSDVAYGTSRMFQTLSLRTRPHITVVRSLKDAYAALGMEPAK